MKGYIQWYLDSQEMAQVTEPFLRYKNARSEIINNASFGMYTNIIKQRFNNNQNTAQYLRFIRGLINNENFLEAFNKTVDKLTFPSLTNQQMFITGIRESLINNSQAYQNLTKQIQGSIQSIIGVLGMTGLDPIIPGSEAYQAMVDLYNGDVTTVDRIITDQRRLDLENTFKGQYSAMISKLPDFIDILSSPGDDADKAFRVLARMLMPIQTLIGVCSEYQSNYELDKILKQLEKEMKSSGMRVERVGDEKDSGFRIGTADLTINLGENPSMSFNVPNMGMSLKRSHKDLSKADSVNIKLKGSTYGGLMQEIDPDLVTAFYTIYANTRPVVRGVQQSQIPAGTLTSAYAQMKARMLVTALIGGSNSDNLVFVMVINNKPFTIFDLLSKLREETYANEATVLLKPSFRTMRGGVKLKDSAKTPSKKEAEMAAGVVGMHQQYYNMYSYNEREKRSAAIRKFIDSIAASMEIKISKKLLKAI